MKENWKLVKEIFAGVLEHAPRERREYINLHCNGNKKISAEVESLLTSYESAEVFLESPVIGEVAETLITGTRELKKGDFINHYEILSKLGTGGMGEVYLAKDNKLERHVAVKVINDNFDDGQSNLKRFFQEAKAASALNHPNIIVVYEIGEIDRLHYIVIEFVEGNTLGAIINRKELSLEQVIDLSVQIVNALAAAHAVGIIHRDIKPENIMIRDDGIVKVLDFGLAKLTKKTNNKPDFEAQTRELLNTQAGMIMGTAAFMSPEQARGKSVDARTDIWSFGVVLFQMLTGRQPFSGETTSDTIAAILTQETPFVGEFGTQIPAELERIVRKTLRKGLKARYQDAQELLEDLKHFRRNLEFGDATESGRVAAKIASRDGRDTDTQYSAVTDGRLGLYSESISSFISVAVSEIKARPNFMVLGLATLSLIIVMGLFGLSKIISTGSTSDGFQKMLLTKLTYEGSATNVATVSPDGKYIAYAVREEGKQALKVRQVASSSVVEIVPPADISYLGLTFTPDGNYIHYTVSEKNSDGRLYEIPVLGGSPRKIASDVDGKVAFSPDGSMMAFVRSQTSIMIADAKGGSQRLLANSVPDETFAIVDWDPTGKSIVSSIYSKNDSKFYLAELSVADGTQRRLPSGPWLRINGVKWLMDGSGIVISGRDLESKFSQIWFVSYPDGEPRRITNDFSTYLDLGLTADNKSLVATKEERLFNIWLLPDTNAENARRLTLDEGRDDGMSGIALTRDGHLIYSVRKIGTIDLWAINADGTGNRQLTFDQGMNVFPLIAGNGRYIVFASDRAGDFEIWRMDNDGGNPVALTDTPQEEGYPGVTPDGNWIVYQRIDEQNLSTIWKVNIDGGTPIQLTKTESGRPTVSPDGKYIACEYGNSGTDGAARLAIIPITGGEPLKVLDVPHVIKSRAFRWTSDGTGIIYVGKADRTDNLWSQPLDSTSPKQLTYFSSGRIQRFDPEPDGKGFALSRGNESSDVVMISDFR